jgi:two-component system, OmpR family, alkaline phosphatase synthesis response regulator PhoP
MAARVLIAEDDDSIVTSLEFLMRGCGFETRVAKDGEAALASVGDFRPDVVILDLMLPRRSGLEVCREVRGKAEWKGTRVLMLTAKGGSSERASSLAAGADDYLMKPFSTQDLVKRVKALVPQ